MRNPTKEQILEASEICPEVKTVLEELYPDAFKEEAITIGFRRKADVLLTRLEELVYELDENEEMNKRVEWIVATFLYSHVPGMKDDRLGEVEEYFKKKYKISY